jgi:hypothetical protein
LPAESNVLCAFVCFNPYTGHFENEVELDDAIELRSGRVVDQAAWRRSQKASAG